MARFALRILPSWPWTVGKPGDLVGGAWMDVDRDALELTRAASPNAAHYEVVELDESGGHRAVASEGGARFACIDCGATSRNRAPAGTCPGGSA